MARGKEGWEYTHHLSLFYTHAPSQTDNGREDRGECVLSPDGGGDRTTDREISSYYLTFLSLFISFLMLQRREKSSKHSRPSVCLSLLLILKGEGGGYKAILYSLAYISLPPMAFKNFKSRQPVNQNKAIERESGVTIITVPQIFPPLFCSPDKTFQIIWLKICIFK